MAKIIAVSIGSETINVTKKELEQAVNTILADAVWALHANEVIRKDDGVEWLDSHTIEICIESGALSVKIVDAEEENKMIKRCPKCKVSIETDVTLKCIGEFTITRTLARCEKIKVEDNPVVKAMICHNCGHEGDPKEFDAEEADKGRFFKLNDQKGRKNWYSQPFDSASPNLVEH